MTDEDNIIGLRGHHLLPLFSKYYEKNSRAKLELAYGKEKSEKIFDSAFSLKAEKYGFNFATESDNLYSFLIQNHEQKVKIINTPDILCKICPIKKLECSENFLDMEMADEFGLKIDMTYSMKEICEKLESKGIEYFKKVISLLQKGAE